MEEVRSDSHVEELKERLMYARHALPRSSSCNQNLLKLALCACVATVKFRIEQGRSIYCGRLVKKCNNPHRRLCIGVSQNSPV